MTNSSTDPESSKRFRAEGLGRLAAVDGIFAIAMTLLFLEIRVPEHAEVVASAGYLLHSRFVGRPISRSCCLSR